ncbi:hypothetical protein [Pantoea septica]|uniref:hypothetical protein n=1 Tax=Pantoea septica TaxID=472695 RepID=UPI0023F6323E|nr:hypothetical protein [Pantoea septica]
MLTFVAIEAKTVPSRVDNQYGSSHLSSVRAKLVDIRSVSTRFNEEFNNFLEIFIDLFSPPDILFDIKQQPFSNQLSG